MTILMIMLQDCRKDLLATFNQVADAPALQALEANETQTTAKEALDAPEDDNAKPAKQVKTQALLATKTEMPSPTSNGLEEASLDTPSFEGDSGAKLNGDDWEWDHDSRGGWGYWYSKGWAYDDNRYGYGYNKSWHGDDWRWDGYGYSQHDQSWHNNNYWRKPSWHEALTRPGTSDLFECSTPCSTRPTSKSTPPSSQKVEDQKTQPTEADEATERRRKQQHAQYM